MRNNMRACELLVLALCVAKTINMPTEDTNSTDAVTMPNLETTTDEGKYLNPIIVT